MSDSPTPSLEQKVEGSLNMWKNLYYPKDGSAHAILTTVSHYILLLVAWAYIIIVDPPNLHLPVPPIVTRIIFVGLFFLFLPNV